MRLFWLLGLVSSVLWSRTVRLQVVTAMTVTLSTDHRAVDGALGAELIGAFKRYIENPMSMLV